MGRVGEKKNQLPLHLPTKVKRMGAICARVYNRDPHRNDTYTEAL